MAALLEAQHLSKVFGGGTSDRNRTVALEDFSLSIKGDESSILSIVGESGSGKTTLAKLLLGLLTPTEGNVLYKGTDLRRLSRQERHGFLKDIQVIFQDPFEVYNPFYKVDHMLTMPLERLGLVRTRKEQRSRIEHVLHEVGLRPEETLGRYPHQLSGGQRQRAMVARALLVQPRLIVADEPVSMIDASLRATVLGALQKLKQDFGISIIYITHDLTTAYQVSDNIMVLFKGSVAEAGSADLVVKQPHHPYAQLLINSIPWPDPGRQWASAPKAALTSRQEIGDVHCKFVDRCPSSLAACLRATPPLYRSQDDRAVACFLYEGSSTVQSQRIDTVFCQGAGRASADQEAKSRGVEYSLG